jgi:hypothetical protein
MIDRINHRLALAELEGPFAVCKLDKDAAIPTWAMGAGLFSVTRTRDEFSVVCRQALVPEGIVCEQGWRCLRVIGAMPFALIGVLASLVTPLAEAAVSIFAISTFDTDYLLVKEYDFEKAVNALRQHGHTFE